LAKRSIISGYKSVSNWQYTVTTTQQYHDGLKINSSIFEKGGKYVLSYKFSI
jgi:hypothetical protein